MKSLGISASGAHKNVIKVLARAVASSQDSTGEKHTLNLTCLLAEFTDLWVIALKASVSCWLWAGGCPLFLVTLGSAHHSRLLHQSYQGKEFTSKIDITMWCNITRKWHSVAFFIFYFLEAIHISCPHSKEEITQGCEYQEVGIIEVFLGNVFKVQEVYKCALVYTFWICKTLCSARDE